MVQLNLKISPKTVLPGKRTELSWARSADFFLLFCVHFSTLYTVRLKSIISCVLLLALVFSFVTSTSNAQTDNSRMVRGTVVSGDTLPYIALNQYSISEFRPNRSTEYIRRYNRLEKYVYRVYPYAKIAGEKIKQYEAEVAGIKNETKKKLAMKKAENALKAEFEGEITNLTINEGRVLIKLIDRETGKTSYNLIKEFRGGFSAFMWQTVSRFFGNNLKDEYNSKGDDKIIEEIVQRIEAGELIVPLKKRATRKEKKAKKKAIRRGSSSPEELLSKGR